VITSDFQVTEFAGKAYRLHYRGLLKIMVPYRPHAKERVRACLLAAGRTLEELDALYRQERDAERAGHPWEAKRLHWEWIRRREYLDRAYSLALGKLGARRGRR
jgi:hypothetical protein